MRKVSLFIFFIFLSTSSIDARASDKQSFPNLYNGYKLFKLALAHQKGEIDLKKALSEEEFVELRQEALIVLEDALRTVAILKHKTDYFEQVRQYLPQEYIIAIERVIAIAESEKIADEKVQALIDDFGNICDDIGNMAYGGLILIVMGLFLIQFIVTIPVCIVLIVVGAVLVNVFGILWVICIFL